MLFGFHGPAGAGKDTCGEYLVANYGFTRLSFASPIYDMLEVAGFGRPKTQAEKETEIPWLGRSWRYLAQTLGTEWGRNNVDANLWVKLVMHKVNSNPEVRYVLTDVRFENEARLIREQGVVIHIRGRKAENTPAHASEQALALFPGDLTVQNDGSIESLYKQLDTVVAGN